MNDLPEQRRTGLMISIPVDLSSSDNMVELEENGVKARRVQVERIEELGGGLLEWRLVTCEDPGGMIPRPCATRMTRERIAKDVAFFLLWFGSQPRENPTNEATRRGESSGGSENT
ncbi:putative protein of unknown function (DUF3074) [Lyophyllum shimeji]|uniref:DUF3074 domain-containing protein n=1 Tax=Lyophyllum shimeji TaxID=47721 RepID=A0A9P3PW97_LYOSH|nr:putative protein of unknown function (DUF3074) [Lyophyllum shimeji]